MIAMEYSPLDSSARKIRTAKDHDKKLKAMLTSCENSCNMRAWRYFTVNGGGRQCRIFAHAQSLDINSEMGVARKMLV